MRTADGEGVAVSIVSDNSYGILRRIFLKRHLPQIDSFAGRRFYELWGEAARRIIDIADQTFVDVVK